MSNFTYSRPICLCHFVGTAGGTGRHYARNFDDGAERKLSANDALLFVAGRRLQFAYCHGVHGRRRRV